MTLEINNQSKNEFESIMSVLFDEPLSTKAEETETCIELSDEFNESLETFIEPSENYIFSTVAPAQYSFEVDDILEKKKGDDWENGVFKSQEFNNAITNSVGLLKVADQTTKFEPISSVVPEMTQTKAIHTDTQNIFIEQTVQPKNLSHHCPKASTPGDSLSEKIFQLISSSDSTPPLSISKKLLKLATRTIPSVQNSSSEANKSEMKFDFGFEDLTIENFTFDFNFDKLDSFHQDNTSIKVSNKKTFKKVFDDIELGIICKKLIDHQRVTPKTQYMDSRLLTNVYQEIVQEIELVKNHTVPRKVEDIKKKLHDIRKNYFLTQMTEADIKYHSEFMAKTYNQESKKLKTDSKNVAKSPLQHEKELLKKREKLMSNQMLLLLMNTLEPFWICMEQEMRRCSTVAHWDYINNTVVDPQDEHIHK